ncbi:probable DNA double-strand break repair Rad50 ATPase [Tribolium madens]|uniref:probable DNA double-strand break repair Rad50 ATPase n=1 Tax=Tribolium madens TaxID=41895 RepID=UPI001CF73A32|nr:probable DNA double-strand break repair Rad50 ATPase [Tribolium madens]
MSQNIETQTTNQAPSEGNQNTVQNGDNLLEKLASYEETFKNNAERTTQLENELKQKDTDLADLKKRLVQLEEEVSEAQKFKAQHLKEAEEVDAIKVKSEETLTRAKGIIFDKTKVIKNQELQIDALNQQIASLKDVVTITKDLLEIRNLEIKQLESKIQCMEDRVGAEKERHDLMHKKLEHMIRYNGDLKREYETQLCLFSALRERYNERELAKGVLDDLRQASTSQTNGDVAPEEKKEEEKKE